MSTLQIATTAADGTRELARLLAGRLLPGDLLVLDGPLGAGKTTFTQGLGEGLGVRGPIASPTFVIARVHPSLADGPELVHVDAYRLGEDWDIEDLDLEADLDRAVMVVEWGRDRVEHLSSSVLLVELERPGAEHLPDGEDLQDPDEPRTLRLSTRGARWEGEAVAALAAALEAGGFDVAVSPDENPQDDRTDEVR